MTYVAAISAAALAMLSTQALAQTQNYPVGGLGDAWAQDQPSSIGINNNYDPSTETYIIPHSGGRRRTTAMPSRYQSRTRSGMEP
jgi:spermidine/putrescine-binding protein